MSDRNGTGAGRFPRAPDRSCRPDLSLVPPFPRSEEQSSLVDGEHKGRKLWQNYNLWNSNTQAVAMANGEFAALRAATGVMNCHDSQQLHNIPVVLDVRVVKRKDNEELSNEIKAIHPRGGAGTVAAPVAAASEKAPWDN